MKLRLVALVALAFAAPLYAGTCNTTIPPSNPDGIYIGRTDDTVTDTRTGLMWKRCEEGRSGSQCMGGVRATHTWAEALARAEASSFAGYTDWRLPSIKELVSLVELCRTYPAINDSMFPNTSSSSVWSGSPNALSSLHAWGMDFSVGYDDEFHDRNSLHGVRLVRDVQ
ncbi:MAG: DUF1566 domain-containing protein [Burkholderiales bacterium]|nr:MAG: DUF1566 domain-containing protein [Burkholderiales bacterium]MCZ2096408.1 DUF1566 domain-containing protein [Anaerolineae bacterium]